MKGFNLSHSLSRILLLPILFSVLGAETTQADPLADREHPANREEAKHRSFQVLPGQRILMHGDSMTKGYGFGNYTDPSPLRTVYGIIQILLKDNLSHPPQYLPLPNVWEKPTGDGPPKTVDTLAGEIQVFIRRGELRTGDWMIYEDGGELDKFVFPAPWPNTKDIYRRYRRSLRDMVLEADNSVGREHYRFMTMFDYDPKTPWCQWDAPLDDGIHSGNDAIRDEAAALGIQVIDMNRIMDRAQDHVQSKGWGRVVGPDGIHPNIYGNYVMALAILDSLGADISTWKLDGLDPHFRHPEAGGDVKTVWGFTRDPSDQERTALLRSLRDIVARGAKTPVAAPKKIAERNESRSPLVRHGRILDHPARQPEETSRPASYEVGKLFQLDKETALLVASLREQGGHDFEIGNDGFIFRDLSEILPERAIPINRLESNYLLKSGKRDAVLGKYFVTGSFVPLGAKLDNGEAHPGAGTGFFLSTAMAFLSDRSDTHPDNEIFIEFLQLKWNGTSLQIHKDKLPAPSMGKYRDVGFNCLPDRAGVLCPFSTDEGILVVRFDYQAGAWKPTASGKPFSVLKSETHWKILTDSTRKFFSFTGELEPSIRRVDDGYLVYTRGSDRRGRVYRSPDGLNYHLSFDRANHTVPQVMSQGLDGSLYLATNTGPGWLRNPLLAYSLRGNSFVDPVVIHDEQQIGDDKGKEVPFVDHAVGDSILLKNQWRHFLVYRVCDLRETDGSGAPPTPQTGLYLTEFKYDQTTHVPFRF